MSSGGSENQPNLQPNLQIMGQYIKDLSFENPGAPSGFAGNPEMDMGVDLKVRPMGPDHYEVVFHIRVKASSEGRTLFILELAYGALVKLTNMPEDAVQRVLLIQAPLLMFPFARRVVADVVRDGGMPPLVIEPIDFVSLYQAKMAQAAQQQPVGTA
ncbi:MAG TPA: protein-export chaperone SecB [Rhizomicrobium sp.]|nr:protein-export chaperone SecB [Rhizomicrobium sp.]